MLLAVQNIVSLMLLFEGVVDWHLLSYIFVCSVCVGTVVLLRPIFWNPFIIIRQPHVTCGPHGMRNIDSCLLDCDTV
jgi:hypothetical protein